MPAASRLPSRSRPAPPPPPPSPSSPFSPPGSSSLPISSSSFAAPLPPQLLANLSALPAAHLLSTALRTARQQWEGLAWFATRFPESGSPSSPPEITARSTAQDAGRDLAVDMIEAMEKAALKASLVAAKTREIARHRFLLFRQPAVAEAYPVLHKGRAAAAICRVDLTSRTLDGPGEHALAAVAQFALLQIQRQEAEHERSLFRRAAALLEIFGNAGTGSDFPECARNLANQLRDLTGCDAVALASRRWGRERLAAVSGLPQDNEGQTAARAALEACLAHAANTRQECRIHASPPAGRHEDGALQALRDCFAPAFGVVAPLIDHRGVVRGAWAFLWKKPPADPSGEESLIRAGGPEFAPLLPLLRRAKPGATAGVLLRVWQRMQSRQRRLLAVAGAIVCGVLLCPTPYPVRTTCELLPVVRRIVAAPFDGILETCHVKVGQTVAENQVLAELDGREVHWQLADAVARRSRSLAEADLALASGKVAEAKMATLQARALEQEIALLQYRTGHLQLRAPVAGLVLQGDWERSEGAPVRTGDALFEIGPLDRVLVTLAVPQEEIAMLLPEAKAAVTLEGLPGETFHGKLMRVSPRSEPLEGKNVFLCELELPNPGARLRPGLKGKGRIQGPWRPLVWAWLRQPWSAARYAIW